MVLDDIITSFITLREKTNPIFGPVRRMFLKNKNFTVISNNCWGGHVYRYFGLPYDTPTVGLYIFTKDYLKFVQNLKYYLSLELDFIDWKSSRYSQFLPGKDSTNCPIARLGDIEIIFLHYNSIEEAKAKWNRRKQRIHWDNIYIKFSEQNICDYSDLLTFDNIKHDKKFMFVHKKYGFASEIVYKEYNNAPEVCNDTILFKKYISLIKWLNNEDFKLRQK